MRSSLSIRIAILSLPLLLAACGDGADKPDPRSDRDPAISGALSDPLMTDPDLASQNEGGAVLSGGGPASGEVPRPKQGPEEVAAARAAAAYDVAVATWMTEQTAGDCREVRCNGTGGTTSATANTARPCSIERTAKCRCGTRRLGL